jgi:hypothetical protein
MDRLLLFDVFAFSNYISLCFPERGLDVQQQKGFTARMTFVSPGFFLFGWRRGLALI